MNETPTHTNHTPEALCEERALAKVPAPLQEDKKSVEAIRTQQIRTLNDVLRTTFTGGMVMFTHGIQNLDEPRLQRVLERVQSFASFTEENDPYGEHDFGIFQEGGESFYWKIDYYNKEMTAGSEEPSDPAITCRVLTIMLSSEY